MLLQPLLIVDSTTASNAAELLIDHIKQHAALRLAKAAAQISILREKLVDFHGYGLWSIWNLIVH